jgi:hypothetical protein
MKEVSPGNSWGTVSALDGPTRVKNLKTLKIQPIAI